MDIHIGRQTFTVPCRRFSIKLSVTNKERLPLVKEFALRYLFVVGPCQTESLQLFFGLNEREIAILISDLKLEGLAAFVGSEIALSEKARDIFREAGNEAPRIQAVDKWHERFAIDFVSFSLIHFESRSEGYRCFHELTSNDLDKVSRSKEIAKEVFASSFHEYVERYKTDIHNDERSRLSIYGISSIESGDKFSFPLGVNLYINSDNPKQIEQRYSVFTTEAAQEKRRRIVQEVAHTLNGLKEKSRFGTDLIWLAEEQLGISFFSQFKRDGRFDVGHVLEQIAEARDDNDQNQMTIPISGALSVPENVTALSNLIEHTTSAITTESERQRADLTTSIFWQKPSNEIWGRDDDAFAMFANIRAKASAALVGNSKLVLVFNASYEKAAGLKWRLTRKNNRNLFDRGLSTSLTDKMGPVEAFLWPGVVGGMLYYYLEDPSWEYPVPLGFVSRDPEVLTRLSRFLFVQWAGHGRKVRQHWPVEGGAEPHREVSGKEVFSTLLESLRENRPQSGILTLRKRRS